MPLTRSTTCWRKNPALDPRPSTFDASVRRPGPRHPAPENQNRFLEAVETALHFGQGEVRLFAAPPPASADAPGCVRGDRPLLARPAFAEDRPHLPRRHARAVLLQFAAGRLPAMPRLRPRHRRRLPPRHPRPLALASTPAPSSRGRARSTASRRRTSTSLRRSARSRPTCPSPPSRRSRRISSSTAIPTTASPARNGPTPGTASRVSSATSRRRPTRCTCGCSSPATAPTTPAPPAGARASSPRRSAGNGAATPCPELYQLAVADLLALVEDAPTPNSTQSAHADAHSADLAYDSIVTRLRYLQQVGLGYLTLDRASRTLSGGEVERVNLTSCLGTSLVDTLFVLDEPSVGLHPRDIDRLIGIIRSLTAAGNTVDRRRARRGHDPRRRPRHRGRPRARRPRRQHRVPGLRSSELLRSPASITGAYLSGRRQVDLPASRRPVDLVDPDRIGNQNPADPLAGIHATSPSTTSRGLTFRLPLQRLVCLSGVSGSGKSTLLDNVIYQGLLTQRLQPAEDPASIGAIRSDLEFGEIVLVDQSPVSRTPRSNPALYSEAWELIRELYAATPAAQAAGFSADQLLLQQRRRPLRPLPGARLRTHRDAVPLRRVRAVRGLRGPPLQARGAGHHLERPVGRRSAQHHASTTRCRSSPASPPSSAGSPRSRRSASAISRSASRSTPSAAARPSASSSSATSAAFTRGLRP